MLHNLPSPPAGTFLLVVAIALGALRGAMGWWTAHPRQRLRCLHDLVGVAACLTGLSALQFGVGLDIVDAGQANVLTGVAVAYCVGMYGHLRSPSDRRVDDRALLSWHLHTCLVFMA